MTNPGIPTEPLHIQTLKRADEMGEPPWLDLVLVDERSQLAMKGDLPGGQGGSIDDHVHYDFIEWWIVLEGELTFEIGDYPPLTARKHDIVTSPFGTRHLITSAGEGRSVRLIVGYPGSEHYADDPDHTKKRGPETIPFPESEREGPPNLIHTGIDDLMASKGEPPWTQVVVKNEHVKGTLLCHGPGMSNTPHWHDDINEWWLLLKGEVSYDYSKSREPFHMREGDVVFMPRGYRHELTTIGDGPSLRLAIGPPEEHSVYTDDDADAPAPLE